MAVVWDAFVVNLSCVKDCGDGSTCLGNFEVVVVTSPASDPFHLIVMGEDFGIITPGLVYDHFSVNNGCAEVPIIINIDGVDDPTPRFADLTYCCSDAAIVSGQCPLLCVT